MKFSLLGHHSSFPLQSGRLRKYLQFLTSTKPVSHLSHSIYRIISQSTCKIVYTEFDHVLIKFFKLIKNTHI